MGSMSNKREISFNPELSERLADLITVEDAHEIIRVLRDGMRAETTIRAPRKPWKEGTPKGRRNDYAYIPDHRVRICSAKILAEMRDGKPRQAVDVNVSGLNEPMPTLEAAKELLDSWDDIKRIGDDHVRLMKLALPAPPNGNGAHEPAQQADAEIVDVDLGE